MSARLTETPGPPTAGVPPRVGLYGLLGSGNLGNDGSAEVIINHLRGTYPGVVLNAICDGPEEMRRRFGVPAQRLHWNRTENQTADTVRLVARKAVGKLVDAVRIARWVAGQDVVIMPGMGAFEATMPLRAWGTPYSQFLVCALGRLLGTKVALVSVGANDVNDPIMRWLFVNAARCAHYVSFRDEYSRDVMRRAGLKRAGHRVFPDLVFALPDPADPGGGTGVVGVGVFDYRGGNDDRHRADEVNETYRESIKSLVHRLLDSGRGVRLLVGATVDDVVVQDVVDSVRASRPADLDRLHIEPMADLHELMDQMSRVDAVVVSRFHNVVCALKLAQPIVSLGYAHKIVDLMNQYGMGEFCHSARDIDVDAVMSQLDEQSVRRDELVTEMRSHREATARRLESQFRELHRLLFTGYATHSEQRRSGVTSKVISYAPSDTSIIN